MMTSSEVRVGQREMEQHNEKMAAHFRSWWGDHESQ